MLMTIDVNMFETRGRFAVINRDQSSNAMTEPPRKISGNAF